MRLGLLDFLFQFVKFRSLIPNNYQIEPSFSQAETNLSPDVIGGIRDYCPPVAIGCSQTLLLPVRVDVSNQPIDSMDELDYPYPIR